ncbi:hypothetical protein M0R45_020584 [Rubus argutus]|uniref:Uncharacterized protein n=1 Tax=Rubus argutus TaxID=59490 RepID=A0AAW1XB34_RUBAR
MVGDASGGIGWSDDAGESMGSWGIDGRVESLDRLDGAAVQLVSLVVVWASWRLWHCGLKSELDLWLCYGIYRRKPTAGLGVSANGAVEIVEATTEVMVVKLELSTG